MYATKNGTKIRNEKAARAAIIMESYHAASTAEYVVYSYAALQHDAQPGDHLLVKSSPDLPDYAYTVNLTNGTTKLVKWEDLAHAIKPV